MSFEKRRRASVTCAVLLLSHATAEWLELRPDGAALVGSSPVLGSAPEDVAKAAVAAMRAAGGTERRIVLALSGQLALQRTLVLPDLARKELARVFPRKAAALLECAQQDVLYAALPIQRERQGAEAAAEQKWQLVALRRPFMLALRKALRRERIQVARVVSAPLARLCEAQRLRDDSEKACIVVDVERDGVAVSLIAGDALRMQNRIIGSFESVPTMALSGR